MRSAALMILRLVLGFVLLVVAFWPGFGFFYGLPEAMRDNPIPWTVILGFWSIGLALTLPFSANAFRRISTVSMTVIFGAVVFWMYIAGLLDISNSDTLIKVGITFAGVILGWWVIAPMIYRSFRRIAMVDESDQFDE